MTVEEIADFLARVHGPLEEGEYINIRCLQRRAGQWAANAFFKTPEEAARYALSQRDEWNVHFGVNPRHLNNATKEGVTRIVSLHADVDVGDDKPYGSKEDAYDALLALMVAPTLIVDSGAGLHAYWKLKPLEATAENIARAERMMASLYRSLNGADRIQDVSRVLKVPGCINHKYGREVRVLWERSAGS